MKKNLFFFMLFLMAGALVQAQDLTQVLDDYFKATGMDKFSKVKTVEMKAKMSQMGMELPMTIKIKKPDKFRMEMEIQGQKVVTAYDGEHGWTIAPWVSPEPQDLAGEQLEQAKEQADLQGDLWEWEKKGHKATLMGKEDLEGTEVYKVKLVKKNGDVQYYYIDTDSNMLLKTVSTVKQNGQEMEVESIMGNYKDFDGIIVPTSIENKVKGTNQSGNIEIESMKFDVDMPDSLFEKPAK
jgi:outer membrane lipoprotein-sorting protein